MDADFSQLNVTGEINVFDLIQKLQTNQDFVGSTQNNLIETLREGLDSKVIKPLIEEFSKYQKGISEQLEESLQKSTEVLKSDSLHLKDNFDDLEKHWKKKLTGLKNKISSHTRKTAEQFENSNIQKLFPADTSVFAPLVPSKEKEENYNKEISEQFSVFNTNWLKVHSVINLIPNKLDGIGDLLKKIALPSKSNQPGFNLSKEATKNFGALANTVSGVLKRHFDARDKYEQALRLKRNSTRSTVKTHLTDKYLDVLNKYTQNRRNDFVQSKKQVSKGLLGSLMYNKPVPVTIAGFKLPSIDLENLRKLLRIRNPKKEQEHGQLDRTQKSSKLPWTIALSVFGAGLMKGAWDLFIKGLKGQNPLQGFATFLEKQGSNLITKPLAKIGESLVKKSELMKGAGALVKKSPNVIKTLLSKIPNQTLQRGLNMIGKSTKALSKVSPALLKVSGEFLKRLPWIGSLFNFADGVSRIKRGDYIRGLISIGAGVANLFPGVGTAISLGLDMLNMWLDYKTYKEEKQQSKPFTNFFKNSTKFINDLILNYTPIGILYKTYKFAKNLVTGNTEQAMEDIKNVPLIGNAMYEFFNAPKETFETMTLDVKKFTSTIKRLIIDNTIGMIPKVIKGPLAQAWKSFTGGSDDIQTEQVNDANISLGNNSVLYQSNPKKMTYFHKDDNILAYKSGDVLDQRLTSLNKYVDQTVKILTALLQSSQMGVTVDKSIAKLLENLNSGSTSISVNGSSSSPTDINKMYGDISRDPIYDYRSDFLRREQLA